jgi:hypothetical protein
MRNYPVQICWHFSHSIWLPKEQFMVKFYKLQVTTDCSDILCALLQREAQWMGNLLCGNRNVEHFRLYLFSPILFCSVRVSVREACIYSLLYTEAGHALLDIVATSVDTVNSALASQGR